MTNLTNVLWEFCRFVSEGALWKCSLLLSWRHCCRHGGIKWQPRLWRPLQRLRKHHGGTKPGLLWHPAVRSRSPAQPVQPEPAVPAERLGSGQPEGRWVTWTHSLRKNIYMYIYIYIKHARTHTHIYTYICVCVCVSAYLTFPLRFVSCFKSAASASDVRSTGKTHRRHSDPDSECQVFSQRPEAYFTMEVCHGLWVCAHLSWIYRAEGPWQLEIPIAIVNKRKSAYLSLMEHADKVNLNKFNLNILLEERKHLG